MKEIIRLLGAAAGGALLALAMASYAETPAAKAPATAGQVLNIGMLMQERFDRLESGINALNGNLNSRLDSIEQEARKCADR